MAGVRSFVHMLTVAAARLKQDHANPLLIADLESAAQRAASNKAAGMGWTPGDTQRVERQRTLFQMLPDTTAVDRLKAAMLQRAYDLMWGGDCSACDAIAEFLPEADVDRMFEAWDKDTTAKSEERSDFYHGGA